jgi:cobyrinic acid a,c-diamide synthase
MVAELPSAEPDSLRIPVRIGYFSDPAFSFYYPENLEALSSAGADLVAIAPVQDQDLPDIDALYIGGGFPEVFAPSLAENGRLADQIRQRVELGLPVYAECGGLMYLARELIVGGVHYPMSGVLDIVVEQTRNPQGHGYEVAVVDRDNPFFLRGTELVGHEFHYSRIINGTDRSRTVLEVVRGSGCGDGRDGIVKGRVWASYLHLHALGTTSWAEGFLNVATHFAAERASARAAWA